MKRGGEERRERTAGLVKRREAADVLRQMGKAITQGLKFIETSSSHELPLSK